MPLSDHLQKNKKNHVLVVLSLPMKDPEQKQTKGGFRQMMEDLLAEKESIAKVTILLADTLQCRNIQLRGKILNGQEITDEEAHERVIARRQEWEGDPENQATMQFVEKTLGKANVKVKYWDDFPLLSEDREEIQRLYDDNVKKFRHDTDSLADNFKNKFKEDLDLKPEQKKALSLCDKEILEVQKAYIFEESAKYRCFHRQNDDVFDYELYVSERNRPMKDLKKTLGNYSDRMRTLFIVPDKNQKLSDKSDSDSSRSGRDKELSTSPPEANSITMGVKKNDIGANGSENNQVLTSSLPEEPAPKSFKKNEADGSNDDRDKEFSTSALTESPMPSSVKKENLIVDVRESGNVIGHERMVVRMMQQGNVTVKLNVQEKYLRDCLTSAFAFWNSKKDDDHVDMCNQMVDTIGIVQSNLRTLK